MNVWKINQNHTDAGELDNGELLDQMIKDAAGDTQGPPVSDKV